MTTIFERRAGAELEGTLMPTPESLPPVPGTSAIPWWVGVPGLDPDSRAASWQWMAQATAMACAAHVLGADAGRWDWWRTRKSSSAATWFKWLLKARGEDDAYMRRLALRLICERTALIPDDEILPAAEMLYEACDPGIR